MKISLVMPQGTAKRTGNHHTAQRWAGFLRQSGHRVRIEEAWAGAPADALIALHARKSAASVEKFHRECPGRPLIVALTGTDLYRDIDESPEAQRALELATRLVVLQPRGRTRLARPLRGKTRVIYQSADTRLTHRPPRKGFRIIVVGNLREEKDPFRAAAALARLPLRADLELLQVGAALSSDMANAANGLMKADSRYRWVGSKPHADALRQMASSHLLVVSSVMEGGANVICEASRIGLPVLASRVSGNIGMLDADYAGYFPLFDDRKLARLIDRVSTDNVFYRGLKRAVTARRALFAPSAERRGLDALLGEFEPRR
jgi:putative glycosyltransferase (TIGR04348 family)